MDCLIGMEECMFENVDYFHCADELTIDGGEKNVIFASLDQRDCLATGK